MKTALLNWLMAALLLCSAACVIYLLWTMPISTALRGLK